MADKYKHYNKITSYTEFCDYILRALGAPVVDINVDPEQMQDRISDAIQYYIEYDLESVAETWMLHKVTSEDVQNGYLTIPPDVLDVMDVLTPGMTSTVTSDASSISTSVYDFGYMDNPQWQWFNQFWINGGLNMGNQTMFYYEVSMQYLSMLKTVLTAKVEFLYRRRQRKLWFLSKTLREGDLYCLYATKVLDPETDDCIWDSDWLKKYATALVGIQYGTNLSKFGGVPSAANLTISGDAILARYQQEKQELEEAHKLEFREPPLPMFGS